MNLVVLTLAAALVAAPVTSAVVGHVHVVRGVAKPEVWLRVAGAPVRVQGDLVCELERLASARVELLGERSGDSMRVEAYRIVDVGGGAKPLVGTLARVGDRIALSDWEGQGEGKPVPLALSPKVFATLLEKGATKVWVYGPTLLSGELKVLRYGILREPGGTCAPRPAEAN